jgi:hypothetical protein
VAFAGEEDFNKIADDAEFGQFAGLVPGMGEGSAVGRGGELAAGDEVSAQDALGHFGEREGGEAAAHVAAGIAILKAAEENLIESGAGDDTELTEAGNGLGEAPTGDTCAHSTLNDDGMLRHAAFMISPLG